MMEKDKELQALDVMYESGFINNEQYFKQKIQAEKWEKVSMLSHGETSKVGNQYQITAIEQLLFVGKVGNE